MDDSPGNNTVLVRVRYADTDQMGVAYNGVYFTWFEIGRTELIRNTGLTYNDIEKRGIRLPVIETGIKFLEPARYDDVIMIRTTIERQKGVRIRFFYEATCEGKKIATGFTEHVFTDRDLRPVKPPKELSNMSGFICNSSDYVQ